MTEDHPRGTRAAWVGWLRQNGRWERVCMDGDLGACHRQLLAIARQRRVRDRDTFLTSGHVPPAEREERQP